MSRSLRSVSLSARALVLAGLVLLGACSTTSGDRASALPSRQQEMQQQYAQARLLFNNKQYAEAARLLLPLAQQGHLNAQYAVGYMYFNGLGLPRNEKLALRWFATAAARGHPKAIEALKRIDEVARQEGAASPQPAAPPVAP